MVSVAGFEPAVSSIPTKWINQTFPHTEKLTYLVPEAGIEPARLSAGDFESPASTNSATRARVLFFSLLFFFCLVCVVGFEPTVSRVRGEWINQIFLHTVYFLLTFTYWSVRSDSNRQSLISKTSGLTRFSHALNDFEIVLCTIV